MQEGCCAIIEAVVEKKMKARGPGQPQGKAKPPKTPAVAYDINECMQGLEGSSEEKPKRDDAMNCRAD